LDLDHRSRRYRIFRFWGFEKEEEEHCIVIPRIAKAEGSKGLAPGHRKKSYGGDSREEITWVRLHQNFGNWELE
jgi:hypothetical protein